MPKKLVEKFHGYSLLEILITIIIISIITVCSVPLFSNFLKREQSKVLANKLIQAVHLAQNIALEQRTSTKIIQNLTGYAIFANEQVIYPLREYQLLHWQGALAATGLEFNAEGKPTTDGSFWLCEGKTHNPLWAIIVNQQGRTRLVYPDRNDEIKDSEGRKLIC